MPDDATDGPVDATEVAEAAAASAAADEEPRRKRGRKPLSEEEKAQRAKDRAKVVIGPTDAVLRQAVEQLYSMAGMGASVFDAELGRAIVACTEPNPFGPGAPEAWVELAKQYPAVRRFLAQVGGTGAIAAMFVAHLPLLTLVQQRAAAHATFGRAPASSVDGEAPGDPADRTPAGV